MVIGTTSCKVLFYLAKRFQRRIFSEIDKPETRIVYWTCLFMDRDEMSYLYSGPSKDDSNSVTVYLGKWFQRRFKCDGRQVMAKTQLI